MKREKEIVDAYERHRRDIYKVAFRYTQNSSDSYDLVETVFTKFAFSDKVFESDEHVKAWLLRVTMNESKNLIKGWWRRNVSLGDDEITINERIYIEDNAFNSLSQNEIEIFNAIKKLPDKYRDIFTLISKELSQKEVAKILNINDATLRTRIKRGKILLKKELEKREDFNYDLSFVR